MAWIGGCFKGNQEDKKDSNHNTLCQNERISLFYVQVVSLLLPPFETAQKKEVPPKKATLLSFRLYSVVFVEHTDW